MPHLTAVQKVRYYNNFSHLCPLCPTGLNRSIWKRKLINALKKKFWMDGKGQKLQKSLYTSPHTALVEVLTVKTASFIRVNWKIKWHLYSELLESKMCQTHHVLILFSCWRKAITVFHCYLAPCLILFLVPQANSIPQ